MTFAEKLRGLRLRRKLSQKQLAELAETTQANITRWEAGLRIPPVDLFQKLCAALGVRVTAFDGVTFEADAKPRPMGRPTKDAASRKR